MITSKKLYAEFRVTFDTNTNQDLLREVCNIAQERIYDLFDGVDDETSGPLPTPHDVTFEIIMETLDDGKHCGFCQGPCKGNHYVSESSKGY